MEFVLILLLGAVTFGVCYLLDKGLKAIFRNKPQHKTGLSVRLNPHYGGAGLILLVLGIAAIISGLGNSKVLLFCGSIVLLLGVGLGVYYLSFGVYYDADSFLLTTIGKKSATYRFADIQGQKLYQVTGGSTLVELYLSDGRTVSLQSNMKGVYPFLDAAFNGWCRQKNITIDDCPFYDPRNSCWFPTMEDV